MLLSSLMPSLSDNEVTEQWQKLPSLYWDAIKSAFKKKKQDSEKIFPADFLQTAGSAVGAIDQLEKPVP